MKPVLALALALAVVPLPAFARDTNPPAITPLPVATPAPGEAVVVAAKILDPSGIFEPTVYWRKTGAGDFEPTLMSGGADDTFRATFVPPAGASGIDYYIEAYDNEGNGPARVGAPEAPLTLALAPSTPAVATTTPPPAPKPVEETKATPPAETKAATSIATTPMATTEAPDLAHTIDLPEPYAWKVPTAIGLAAAGVVLAVVGAVVLQGAQSDATAFNGRFNSQGAYSDADSRSISTRQGVGVGLVTGGIVVAGAGASLFVIRF